MPLGWSRRLLDAAGADGLSTLAGIEVGQVRTAGGLITSLDWFGDVGLS